MTDATTQPTALVAAPHALAARAARDVMADGGDAVEATVAAAATLAVVYPHMNGLGGDGFWLVKPAGGAPVAIHAAGTAGSGATVEAYRSQHLTEVPRRGSLAAATTAGTVAGWHAALRWSRQHLGSRLPVSRLLQDAERHARQGFPTSRGQHAATAAEAEALRPVPGFADVFLPGGRVPAEGETFVQPRLADTLARLVDVGLSDFWAGDVAASLAADLAAAGSPVTADDLAGVRATLHEPLRLEHSRGVVWNLAPPTQGLASLVLLGLLDRVLPDEPEPAGLPLVHLSVEAAKAATALARPLVGDERRTAAEVARHLRPEALDALARRLDVRRASRTDAAVDAGDTVWAGATDRHGTTVSFIQSTFSAFGSGVVLPATGVAWHNRATAFSLDPAAPDAFVPGRLPRHTLNPGLAQLDDGRTVAFGAMGGDHQPQHQAAVLTRYLECGLDPAAAVAAPRWTWGRDAAGASDLVRVESGVSPDVVAELVRRGHDVEVVPALRESMGHAGLVVRDADGRVDGAHDPRSDGGVERL
ncbi:gamma-glutamyltransferase family protein [Aeromicrobium massiliense]|uniref:gamma-glutamyltransferase family protein n=1 Tax=Aeromicrobium massiliense TaxID=1464554 RepID=UPI00057829D5|nr:gamma-glutamyltransferase [Aeromicrobium massiliense]